MGEEIIIPIATFLTIFGILYVFRMARHKERMALIERGQDPKILSYDNGYGALKFGLLLVGLAMGILTGYFLDVYVGMEVPAPYFAMMGLFGGLALIIFYLYVKKQEEASAGS